MPRHPNDIVEQLWCGAADPTKPRYVPVERCGIVTDIPADVEERMRRELYTTPEMVPAIGREAVTTNGQPVDLERAAHYRCAGCAEVQPHSAPDRPGGWLEISSVRRSDDGHRVMPEHGIEPLFIVAVVVSLLMWVGIDLVPVGDPRMSGRCVSERPLSRCG